MGAYLNSQTPYTLYQSESRSPYFVDKTMLLQELFPYVAAGNRHLCVTRPRRFGKTIAANMISSFFQKGIDSGELFDRLKISEADDCQKYKTSITSFGLISVKCRETVNLTDSISSVWKNF